MEGVIPDCLRVTLLLYIPTLTYAYEKCTQGISADECYVGKCCKINGVWECRLDGLDECASLAEPDTSATQRPPSSDDTTDTASIAVPVGVAAGCVLILILFAIFAVYMRRLYREKRRSSTYTYQDRTNTAINSSRNRLVDEAYQEQSPEEQNSNKTYTNSYKHSKSCNDRSSSRTKTSYETSQNTNERYQESDSSTRSTHRENRNSQRNRPKSKRKISYENDNFQGEANEVPATPVWSTYQQHSNDRSRRNLPLRDYDENRSRPSRDYDENGSRPSRDYDENRSRPARDYDENRSRPSRDYDENRSRPARDYDENRSRPAQKNREDNSNDNLLFLEPYQTRPGRSRPSGERLPNDTPPSYAETMKQTEV